MAPKINTAYGTLNAVGRLLGSAQARKLIDTASSRKDPSANLGKFLHKRKSR